MKICLIRHGETAWNAEGRLQGWTDIALNATGRAQARAVGLALAGTRFDAVISSPLERALHTAQAIAGRQAIRQEPGLRERHFGELQGLTRGEIAASFPAIQAELNARSPSYQPPGGESLQDFAARVLAVFRQLRQQHRQGQQLLVVAHGGVLDIAYRMASDQDLHSPRLHALPNAAINWLQSTPTGWRVEAWGLDGHLTGALDELS
ncbi:MAG: histidine phosphatase family protein [Inhella sp.]